MLITDAIFIRFPEVTDGKLLHNFHKKNKKQLQRWCSLGQLSQHEHEWEQCVALWIDEHLKKKGIRFLFFSRERKDCLLGMCCFTNIILGPLKTCHLGFSVDYEHGNPELLMEALTISINYMFNQANLHRIMANYRPENIGTAHLLKQLGFRVEGYAYDYLLTDTGWQDCILSSLVNQT